METGGNTESHEGPINEKAKWFAASKTTFKAYKRIKEDEEHQKCQIVTLKFGDPKGQSVDSTMNDDNLLDECKIFMQASATGPPKNRETVYRLAGAATTGRATFADIVPTVTYSSESDRVRVATATFVVLNFPISQVFVRKKVVLSEPEINARHGLDKGATGVARRDKLCDSDCVG